MSKQPESYLDQIISKLVVGAAIAGATASGCNAPGYFQASPEARARGARVLATELGIKTDEAVDNYLSTEQLKVESIEDIEKYETPESLKEIVDTTFKSTSKEAKAFNALDKQVELIRTLFGKARVKRVMLNDLKRNIDYQGFQIAPLNKDELKEVIDIQNQLGTYLRGLAFEQLQELDKALGENPEYQAMRQFRDTLLTDLYRIAVMRGKVNHHEFMIEMIERMNQDASAIHKSLTGQDRYAEGRKYLEQLLEKKVGDVIDPQGLLATEFDDPKQTLQEVYQTILNDVWEEAQSMGRKTRHNVSRLYGLAKAIASDAHKARKYVTQEDIEESELTEEEQIKELSQKLNDERFIAVKNAIASDIAEKFIDGIPEEEGLGLGYKLLGMTPIGGPIIFFDSIRPAVSLDDYEPKGSQNAALKETLEEAARQDYGMSIGYNWKGNTAPFIVDSVIGGIGTAEALGGLAGGGYLVWRANWPDNSKRASAQATPPGQAPVGGGGGTSGGIK